MRLTPAARMASSTRNVPIVFCSQILLRVVGPEPDVGVGRQVKHEVGAAHRGGQRGAVEDVALDELEPPARRARPAGTRDCRSRGCRTPTTSSPRANSRSTRLLPMKPAPPVTNAFMILSKGVGKSGTYQCSR